MGKFREMMTAEQKAEREKRKKEHSLSPIETCDSCYYYPQEISFNDTQLPEISKLEVGKSYEITVKVKMRSYEDKKRDSGDGKKEKKEGRFEILAVKSEGKGLNSEQKEIMEKMGV